MAQLNFDASTVTPDSGVPEALPAGWYKVMMIGSEMKPTKDGLGSYLECKYNILDGAFTGKTIYGRMNLRNNNAQAQEIAYKQLSAICHSVGVLQVQDSAQLHNLPLQIKLKLREARKELDAAGNVVKEYEASNEINGYRNINEVIAAVGGFPAKPASVPPMQPSFATPPMQPAAQFAPPAQMQAPAQMQQPAQVWQQPMQPAQQPMQQQQPMQPQQAPAWQAPAAAQPWQQPQAQMQQAPVQQQAPAQQQQPMQMQQPNPAPVAQAATPPWMQPQQPA